MSRDRSGEVVIVGGGLVGSLLARFLVGRGLGVRVVERRADPRAAGAPTAGRSINLVVTSRGIRALEAAGLWESARRLTIAVRGRLIHGRDGRCAEQPYGSRPSDRNYSISRLELNRFLIDRAERHGARFDFGWRLVGADLARGRLSFRAESGGGSRELDAALAVGADGAGSTLRSAIARLPGAGETIEPLSHGYKELLIPADAAGNPRLASGALHLWPRGRRMLMALPNTDGSFTVTLYLPLGGPDGFAALEQPDAVVALFRREFPDALPLIPDLESDFLRNPTGTLATVRCAPWHAAGRALLIGDAAHAMVPFFGQGMNAGFEDCLALDRLLDAHGPDWSRLLPAFDAERKPHADAIAEMALDNFVEMSDRAGDPAFLLRKQVERRLELELGRDYRSRYAMVVYGSIPYALVLEAGRIQEGILDELCRGLESAAALDLDRARSLIAERLTPFFGRAGVACDS